MYIFRESLLFYNKHSYDLYQKKAVVLKTGDKTQVIVITSQSENPLSSTVKCFRLQLYSEICKTHNEWLKHVKSHVLKLKLMNLPQKNWYQIFMQNMFTVFICNCNKVGNPVFYPKLYLEIGTY